jgi:hypothetical protein
MGLRYVLNSHALKERLVKIRTWMKGSRFTTRLVFIVTGVIATLWFLIRVIPKPSRANYPCMRIAAPLMSGLVVYLLSLGGLALMIRKARQNFLRASYKTAGFLVIGAILVSGVFLAYHSPNSSASTPEKVGPDDGPNQAIGTGIGINPGRVVWVWDPKATNENCINVFDFPKPENTPSFKY